LEPLPPGLAVLQKPPSSYAVRRAFVPTQPRVRGPRPRCCWSFSDNAVNVRALRDCSGRGVARRARGAAGRYAAVAGALCAISATSDGVECSLRRLIWRRNMPLRKYVINPALDVSGLKNQVCLTLAQDGRLLSPWPKGVAVSRGWRRAYVVAAIGRFSVGPRRCGLLRDVWRCADAASAFDSYRPRFAARTSTGRAGRVALNRHFGRGQRADPFSKLVDRGSVGRPSQKPRP